MIPSDLAARLRLLSEASFFDLGGHSVLATRVVAQLRKREHPGITLRMLFDSPAVADLARVIVGGGSRHIKLSVTPAALSAVGVEFVDRLALPS